MATVPWNFGMLVLNNILLDEGGSRVDSLTLFDGIVVDLSVRKETTVAWDVACHFLGSDGKFIFFVVGDTSGIVGQQVSGVVAKGPESLGELSIVAAS